MTPFNGRKKGEPFCVNVFPLMQKSRLFNPRRSQTARTDADGYTKLCQLLPFEGRIHCSSGIVKNTPCKIFLNFSEEALTASDIFSMIRFCKCPDKFHVLFSLGSNAQFGKQIRREIFRQVKVWKSGGILCVFQTFPTAELAEKIRRSARTQLCGVAFTITLIRSKQYVQRKPR